MSVDTFSIQGLKLITLKCFGDDRGFFTERFRESFLKQYELPPLIQDNFSRSSYGVLRGLHFQTNPTQGKLITCLNGTIYDVAVDIRKGSPTYGKYTHVILDGNKPQWFWIPAGFAHGFCVVSQQGADVMYKVDNYYSAQGDGGLIWNDPTFKIEWPLQNPNLSPKDQVLPTFAEYSKSPLFSMDDK
jgi:dTDP-4-dehydrorhamnose 3,5-epimerase